MSSALQRFGISIEGSLLGLFDESILTKGYQNRSEAIRDLIRADLVKQKWDLDQKVAAVLSIVYDHHVPGLISRLVEQQHDFGGAILASLHVHLDHHTCLEAIVLSGVASDLQNFSDRVISMRGVRQGRLTVLHGIESDSESDSDSDEHAHHPTMGGEQTRNP